MPLYRIALLLLVLQTGDIQIQDIRIDKNEVSIQTSAGLRQITHDGTEKRLPLISPDGSRIVYLAKNESGKPEDIVEIDMQGKLLRHMIPDHYIPGPFDRLEWIDNQRIGAMTCGHANCAYWILDADTGRQLRELDGGFDFVWSNNRRWVARRFISLGGSGGGEAPAESDRLMLNEDWTYPTRRELESATPHGHTLGESIVWSPSDAWVAFTDMQGPEGDNYVVLVSPGGVILRDTIAGDVSFNTQIKWSDDTHLDVMAGGRIFHLVVAGNELHDVTPAQ
jgi:hypothetical protein